MLINVNNYSLSYLSDDKLDLDSDIKFQHRGGCNVFVKNSNCKYLYIVIPKSNVDEVLKEIHKLSGLNYTLDDILKVYKEMTFEYDYKYYDNTTKFIDKSYEGYYKFEIKITSNRYHRYYAFCMIRHFYYAQDILTRYMELYHKLKDDLEKILALSVIARFQGQYTFVGTNIPIIKDITFGKLLKHYYNSRCNQNSFGIKSTLNLQNYNAKNILVEVNNLRNVFITYDNTECSFNDSSYIKILKNYILESTKNYNRDIFKLNIDIDQLNKFKNGNYYSKIINNLSIGDSLINIPYNAIIFEYPSQINMSKNLLKKEFFINPIAPKYIVNVDKVFKNTDETLVLNKASIITSLKNRNYLNAICSQKEAIKFPFKLVRSLKVKGEQEFIINNIQEFESFIKTNNIKKYIKQPLLKNSIKHYLFFTKQELFLHQVKLQDRIIDNYSTEILQHVLPYNNRMVKHCHKVFKESSLDIGVITVEVSLENNNYLITDISPFVRNGQYSTNMYINQINKVINQACVV